MAPCKCLITTYKYKFYKDCRLPPLFTIIRLPSFPFLFILIQILCYRNVTSYFFFIVFGLLFFNSVLYHKGWYPLFLTIHFDIIKITNILPFTISFLSSYHHFCVFFFLSTWLLFGLFWKIHGQRTLQTYRFISTNSLYMCVYTTCHVYRKNRGGYSYRFTMNVRL